MRLPIIPPAELNAEQKPLYDDMRDGIARNFQGFINIRDDGALLGPWNPWIHEPKFGKPVWELTKAMVSNPSLPANVREVAILVTGAHFKSAYELYAHVMVAEHRGLSDEKLATIVAGCRTKVLLFDYYLGNVRLFAGIAFAGDARAAFAAELLFHALLGWFSQTQPIPKQIAQSFIFPHRRARGSGS